MNKIHIGIIVIFFCAIFLAILLITMGSSPAIGINIPDVEEKNVENSLSSNTYPAGPQTTGSKFSGEVRTCTNITDSEQVIDLRLINLDVENQSISVYPLNTTIDLLKNTKISIDLPLPYGVSTLKLVSSNGEELTIEVPLCISGGWSGDGSDSGSQSSFSGSTDKLLPEYKPPPPVPELSTIALTGFGVFGLLFIIRRSKI